MKKILTILGSLSLTAAGATPVMAFTSSNPNKDFQYSEGVDELPNNFEAVISDDQKSIDVSFESALSIQNNKSFPKITEPDINKNATKDSDILNGNNDQRGIGIRLSTTLTGEKGMYPSSNKWGLYDDDAVYDYDSLWSIGKTMDADVKFGKILNELNLRNVQCSLVNDSDNKKLNHTELSDQDSKMVTVPVKVSFTIDLPYVPLMLNVSFGRWAISYSYHVIQQGVGQAHFKMWLPSKSISKDADKGTAKIQSIR